MFAHGDCDLEIDTTRAGPEACAAAVEILLASPERSAFDRLRDSWALS